MRLSTRELSHLPSRTRGWPACRRTFSPISGGPGSAARRRRAPDRAGPWRRRGPRRRAGRGAPIPERRRGPAAQETGSQWSQLRLNRAAPAPARARRRSGAPVRRLRAPSPGSPRAPHRNMAQRRARRLFASSIVRKRWTPLRPWSAGAGRSSAKCFIRTRIAGSPAGSQSARRASSNVRNFWTPISRRGGRTSPSGRPRRRGRSAATCPSSSGRACEAWRCVRGGRPA